MEKVKVTMEFFDEKGEIKEKLVREGTSSLVIVGNGDTHTHDVWADTKEHIGALVAVLQGFVTMHKRNDIPLLMAGITVRHAISEILKDALAEESEAN